MKCPRCKNELRRSKKNPEFGLCDTCRKKFTWEVDEDEYEFDDLLQEENKETIVKPKKASNKSKKSKKKILPIVLGVLVVLVLLCAGAKMFRKSEQISIGNLVITKPTYFTEKGKNSNRLYYTVHDDGDGKKLTAEEALVEFEIDYSSVPTESMKLVKDTNYVGSYMEALKAGTETLGGVMGKVTNTSTSSIEKLDVYEMEFEGSDYKCKVDVILDYEKSMVYYFFIKHSDKIIYDYFSDYDKIISSIKYDSDAKYEATEGSNDLFGISNSSSTSTEPTKSTDAAEIRPEFKQAMESYEAFFDEYVEFMQSYSASGNALDMMGEYSDYLTKYSKAMSDFSALENENLTTAEAALYAEVSIRIQKKLLSVASAVN